FRDDEIFDLHENESVFIPLGATHYLDTRTLDRFMTIATFTGGIASTNAFILKGPSGTVMVDAPEGAASWAEASGDVPDALLLTHAHFDHVLDASAIQERWKCPLYGFAPPTPELTLEVLFPPGGSSIAVRPYSISEIQEGDRVEVAGFDFTVLHIPGHSTDSLLFHLDSEKYLFGGDVLMQGGVGRTDFPGGSEAALLGGIRDKLLPLDQATVVFPGHGPRTTIGAEKASNPFLQGL
ncbi:MAG: MBL fold metallo-hydrolase, partial [Acidobacteriota bacterium]